jgi:glycogen(starch) synthase
VRVLFWSGTFWPHIGGVEVLATKLLPALHERGYDFIVVTSQQNPEQPVETQYKGIPIYRFVFHGNHSRAEQLASGLMMVKRQIAQLKRTFAPDLMHINAGGLSEFFHLITAKAYPAPLLATLHGEWPTGNNALAKHILGVAKWVVGCSAAILDKGRQLVPEITSRSSVIYNGLEVPSLLPRPLPTETPRLLCLGRLSPEKGFDVAVTAFASLANRFPHAHLVIVGEGPERIRLERQISELGLTHRVELTGGVLPDQVPALLNTVTAVLLPSRQESFGLVALEAALMARPVVATRVGGLPEVVVHKQTGLLVENENSEALAEAVAALLTHPTTAAQMGQSARLRAHQVFSWEQHVNAYDALYRKLIKDARELHLA